MSKTTEELEKMKADQEKEKGQAPPPPPPTSEKKETPKKFLGKFDSEEDAGKALGNLERRLTELAEDNKFLQEQLESTTAKRPRTEEVDEDAVFGITPDEKRDLLDKPETVFKNYGKRLWSAFSGSVNARNNRAEALKTYGDTLKNTFYQDNKDLIGHELIVGAIGTIVQRENPQTPPHLLLGRIAERSKEYITNIRNGGGTSKGTFSENGETRGGNPPRKSDSEQELDKSIKFQRGMST